MNPEGMRIGALLMRVFLPAKNYEQSQAFYRALGFSVFPLGDKLCNVRLGEKPGGPAFLLQDYYAKEWADNCMMHMLVNNVDEWWAHFQTLDFEKLGGSAKPPKVEPWGLRISYVVDPSGVLWHFAQDA